MQQALLQRSHVYETWNAVHSDGFLRHIPAPSTKPRLLNMECSSRIINRYHASMLQRSHVYETWNERAKRNQQTECGHGFTNHYTARGGACGDLPSCTVVKEPWIMTLCADVMKRGGASKTVSKNPAASRVHYQVYIQRVDDLDVYHVSVCLCVQSLWLMPHSSILPDNLATMVRSSAASAGLATCI